ncbi:BQ5605_C023g09709 [Microbotryum silenes-dioicae]|uniref:BQ5605_C023g09709 protein n=1 Tax=Microbotryum silenes-dioicae TaxID=796604 RepID=A0A2X0PKX6_9BASI|nr:BQ5605_C023g09709 [Microbotryum silenes-dioicae]
MYQHTVVSAAPACGVHVPIRSHVQALWSPGTQGGPSQPRQVLGARVAPYHGLPWACSSARCWAPRGSTLLFAPHRSTESAPRRVMTKMQPILALRHVYEPAASAPGSNRAQTPQAHISIRDDLGPQTAVCTHCKARHWELGPPVFRVFGRLYHRLGALIPAVTQRPTFAQTWLIDPAEATDTRLGPDGADSRMQRSTLTKLESILRTGNRFVREFASAKARAGWDTAKEWILRLCLPPGRERRTHNLLTSSTEMAMLICDSDTNMGDPRSIRLRCLSGSHYYFLQGKMASTPTFLFAGSTKPGRQSPETESRSTMVSNCARYLPVSVWMTKTKRRTKTATMRMKTARKGTKRMVMANVRFFSSFSDLPKATSTSQSRIAPSVPSWRCDGVCCQRVKVSAADHDDVRPRLTGNQGCTGADSACNRPDLIARVFEAKSGNKRHAGCFGDECKMNRFCFFATVQLSCYFLDFILPLI